VAIDCKACLKKQGENGEDSAFYWDMIGIYIMEDLIIYIDIMIQCNYSSERIKTFLRGLQGVKGNSCNTFDTNNSAGVTPN